MFSDSQGHAPEDIPKRWKMTPLESFGRLKHAQMIFMISLEFFETHTIKVFSRKFYQLSKLKIWIQNSQPIFFGISSPSYLFSLREITFYKCREFSFFTWILEKWFFDEKKARKARYFSYHAVISPPKDDLFRSVTQSFTLRLLRKTYNFFEGL